MRLFVEHFLTTKHASSGYCLNSWKMNIPKVVLKFSEV